MPDLVRNVSDTAFLVAAFRAIESDRVAPLFSDPLAARLAGERGMAMARGKRNARLRGWPVLIRTVIIDEYIRASLARVDTVLNLGAGLDTRPYRMDLPAGLRWIEVDLAEVVDWKRDQLRDQAPRCRLEHTALDLTDPAARGAFLDEACSASASGVLVLTEGVVLYWDEAEVAGLAGDLRARERVRGWILDYLSEAVHRYRERRGAAMPNAPFKFRPADWFAFFAAHGWRVKQMRYLARVGADLGRPIPLPGIFKLLIGLRRTLSRVRGGQDGDDQQSGYALLEPSRD